MQAGSSPQTLTRKPPPEQMIMQMGMSYFPSRVLCSALQLKVFSHLKGSAKSTQDIAKLAGASTRGMAMLLDCLVGIELLSKNGGSYSLTPTSEKFLCQDSPDYLGAMYENDRIWEDWGHLTEVIKTGKSVNRLEQQKGAEDFFPALVKSLHIMNRGPAVAAARALGLDKKKGHHILDVACGSGVWGIAAAELDSEAHVTAQDYPGVLEHTRSYLKRHGVDSRYDYLPGDLKKVEFGRDRYDVALLGNIVHSEGEASSRDLFKRVFNSLRSGGKLVVVDMIPNNDRSSPPFPLFFALNMLLSTSDGSTYTLAEYTDWLKAAGFAMVETVDIGSHSPLVIGIKK